MRERTQLKLILNQRENGINKLPATLKCDHEKAVDIVTVRPGANGARRGCQISREVEDRRVGQTQLIEFGMLFQEVEGHTFVLVTLKGAGRVQEPSAWPDHL